MWLRKSWPLCLGLLLVGCGSVPSDVPGPSARSVAATSATRGIYKVGNPYQINGRWYYPEYAPDYVRTGVASWYGDDFQGRPTANGEVFDKELVTAAHPTLPLPSRVRVTNLENGRTLELRVNDRGPFVDDRLIDLSQAAARELGYEAQGLARVKVEFMGLADGIGEPPLPHGRETAIAAAPTATPVLEPPRPASAPVQVASLDVPVARAGVLPNRRGPDETTVPARPGGCGAGPQWVQVGAFTSAGLLRAAVNELKDVHPVRTEPVLIGRQAAMRVRLGPARDQEAAAALLGKVRRLGYTEAFLASVDANGASRSC